MAFSFDDPFKQQQRYIEEMMRRQYLQETMERAQAGFIQSGADAATVVKEKQPEKPNPTLLLLEDV